MSLATLTGLLAWKGTYLPCLYGDDLKPPRHPHYHYHPMAPLISCPFSAKSAAAAIRLVPALNNRAKDSHTLPVPHSQGVPGPQQLASWLALLAFTVLRL